MEQNTFDILCALCICKGVNFALPFLSYISHSWHFCDKKDVIFCTCISSLSVYSLSKLSAYMSDHKTWMSTGIGYICTINFSSVQEQLMLTSFYPSLKKKLWYCMSWLFLLLLSVLSSLLTLFQMNILCPGAEQIQLLCDVCSRTRHLPCSFLSNCVILGNT